MGGINKKTLISALKVMNIEDKIELKQILQEILSPEMDATSVYTTIPNFGNAHFSVLNDKIVVVSGTKKWTINLSDF